jgi:hypothetical protein
LLDPHAHVDDGGAVGTDVRLDACGELADGGQVDAEQPRALVERRRRRRPAQGRVVPPRPLGCPRAQ